MFPPSGVTALIHPDQTGFMVGREARDNTIRALHILRWAQRAPEQGPCVVVSMGAEKAFDRVNWVYMLTILHEMG